MRILAATITWKSEGSGCLEQPFPGIRPSFAVGEDLIMCQVEPLNARERMAREKECKVLIKLPYGEEYADYLHVGMDVRLQVGERIIATGNVERIQ